MPLSSPLNLKDPLPPDLFNIHAEFCKTISHPNRIALLYALGDGQKHVNQLVEALDLPQGTVSRHLKILRERAIVTTQRDGSFIYYQLADPTILQALELMRHVMLSALKRQQAAVGF